MNHRDAIQQSFSELVANRNVNRKEAILCFSLGYLTSVLVEGNTKFKLSDKHKDDPIAIFNFVKNILNEWLVEEPESDEINLDELLQNLLEESVEKVDALVAPPINNIHDLLDEEIDALVASMKKELDDLAAELTSEEKEKYSKIYKQIGDYITTNFDGIIMRIDVLSSKENEWMRTPETTIEEMSLKKQLNDAVENKLREVLNSNIEIQRFKKWCSESDDDNDGPDDWWKLV